MKLLRRFVPGLALAATLVACSSNDAPQISTPTPLPLPPPPVSFTAFVQTQFASTADNTDPVEVDSIEFAFDSADDALAFDDLLQP